MADHPPVPLTLSGSRETSRRFKPSPASKKIRINIIPPEGGVLVKDVESLDDLIEADVWEGRIKIGRYRLKDIKAKFG